MGLVSRLKRLVGGADGDDESPYVCINCGAGLEKAFRECPECGTPYVTAREET